MKRLVGDSPYPPKVEVYRWSQFPPVDTLYYGVVTQSELNRTLEEIAEAL